MRNRHLILAALVAALIFGAGCSSDQDIQQLNQNEFTLRGMIASDRQQIDALNNQVRRLQDEITQLKHGAGSGEAQGGATVPKDMNDRLARLETEVGSLQAALPTIPPAPAVGSATAPGVPGAPAVAPPTGAPPTAAAAPPAPAQAPTWPQELDQELAATQSSHERGVKLFREGLDAMKSGHYPAAIDKLTRFSERYRSSPLAVAAEYFAGNAMYESGKFEDSIVQFNDVVGRFPKNPYACQSLLRQGQAFAKLNDKIDARLTLEKLSSNDQCSTQQQVANNLLKSLSE